MQDDEVGTAIGRALQFIRKEQAVNGSFITLASPVEKPFYCKTLHHTTFVPAIILNALSGIDQAEDIRQSLAAWLLEQRSEAWSFNFWSKDSPERHTAPYPDDLDDTFCALVALYRNDPSSVSASALGSIVRLLLATETKVGGPYSTWLVSKNSEPVWLDVDLAVNSNIAYFLQMAAQPIPSLTRLIEIAVTEKKIHSPYYPSPIIVVYYAARAYKGKNQKHLAEFIKTLPMDQPQSLALAISALYELGYGDTTNDMLKRLLAAQMPDGSWPAEAFCYEPQRKGNCYYYGSRVLTTSLALEAIHKSQARPDKLAGQKNDTQDKESYARLLNTAREELSGLGSSLRPRSLAMVDYIARGDTSKEILMLPQLFYSSLTRQIGNLDAFLARLSLASLYGWMAYTIYDNVMDGEGDVTILPVATMSLCQSLTSFMKAMPGHEEFHKFAKKTFADIDDANAWEAAHCRFPVENQHITIGELPIYNNIDKLAGKSLGHTLAPMAILVKSGYSLTCQSAAYVQQGLKHYIGARQLLDDMHDWIDDLKNGRATYVVAATARGLELIPGTYDLQTLLPKFRRHFWHKTLLNACYAAERNLADSRECFARSGIIKPSGPVDDLLGRLESSIKKNQSRAISSQ